MHVILPKTYVEFGERDLPLFFLAGPCSGAPDWHPRMAELITARIGECIFVIPRRYDKNHPLSKIRFVGDENHFRDQLDFERHYLELAAKMFPHGCLVFWCAEESIDSPRDDGEPYAKDTHNELSEWRGQFIHDHNLRIVLGADRGFRDLRYQERQYEKALWGSFPLVGSVYFHSTMEQTADHAVEVARKSRTY